MKLFINKAEMRLYSKVDIIFLWGSSDRQGDFNALSWLRWTDGAETISEASQLGSVIP